MLIAQHLIAWAQELPLDGELTAAEPKRLRYRALHVAARVVRAGRRTILRLPNTCPWGPALLRAFARLRALPTRAG